MQAFISFSSAIAAGLVGEVVTRTPFRAGVVASGGHLLAFDISAGVLVLCCGLILATWTENYGSQAEGWASTAVLACLKDTCVWALGLATAFWDTATFLFVFSWTPAVEALSVGTVPYGLIFTTYMLAAMLGCASYEHLARLVPAEAVVCGVCALGLVFHFAMASFLRVGSLTGLFLSFVGFEFCIGLFEPASSDLKGRYVAENVRMTIYNIYRIPHTVIIVVVLLVAPTRSLHPAAKLEFCHVIITTNIAFVAAAGCLCALLYARKKAGRVT